jgi:hypothetical protein
MFAKLWKKLFGEWVEVGRANGKVTYTIYDSDGNFWDLTHPDKVSGKKIENCVYVLEQHTKSKRLRGKAVTFSRNHYVSPEYCQSILTGAGVELKKI